MNHVKELKCASCGAPLRFDPEKGKLVCDSCRNEQDIPSEYSEEAVSFEGFDFGSLNSRAEDPDAAPVPVYNCVSCGAEVIAADEQISTTCPYCGNNIVLTDKISGKLRPDGLIPFRIHQKQLPDAVKSFYKGKELLPKDFFTEQKLSKVTGIYVPFWVFSGNLSGELRFHGEITSSHRSGDYVVTETRNYQVYRDADLNFEDIPVDASSRIADKLTDSLEPFDMSDVKPFDMRYLAGFTADRFDLASKDVAKKAKSRMQATAENAVISTVEKEYSGVKRTGGSLRTTLSARYLLLPVYLFTLTYGGKKYEFAVNGQNGKVVGELPISRSVSLMYFLMRFLPVLAAVLAVFIGRYLMGR